MTDRPETRYVLTEDGVYIAYQVLGSGPVDVVFSSGYVSNVDAAWDHPTYGDFFRALARRARLILFDRRGTGVSDRVGSAGEMALEKGMDDLRAVMDAAGSERALIYGHEAGAAVGLLFAASYPDRTLGLVLYAPLVYYWKTPDFPWGTTEADDHEWQERVRTGWWTEDFWRWNLGDNEPEASPDDLRKWALYARLSASPGAALAELEVERTVDVRSLLPQVHVPTLVLVKTGDLDVWGAAPWVAEQIPGARFRELPGRSHWPLATDTKLLEGLDAFIAEIREEQASFDRVLTTVLFTDIIDSTATAAVMGDAKWRALLADHDRAARGLVARFRGTYHKSTGDGLMATFDGPARAVRCARALTEAVRAWGIEVRAGAHTGEIAVGEGDLSGLGVHVAARVAALAGPSEVLVSSTVKDLVAGSGLVFEDRGEHTLKGVPEKWRIYAATT